MSREFFEQVADAVVGFVPPELGPCSTRFTAGNLKLWFGDEPKEHYEAQFLHDGTFEIGFHTEHRASERNDAVLATLVAREDRWRKRLGDAPVAGGFAGAPDSPWRRVSEIGDVPDMDDVESALDVADRLAEYAEAIEPIRSSSV